MPLPFQLDNRDAFHHGNDPMSPEPDALRSANVPLAKGWALRPVTY